MKRVLLRAALSLAMFLSAGEAVLLFYGAGYGYGYGGFADKTSGEMALINLEMGLDFLSFLIFLLGAVLAWRQKPLGRWFYVVLSVPLLVNAWWSYQCFCHPIWSLVPLPIIGMVVLWANRGGMPNTAFNSDAPKRRRAG